MHFKGLHLLITNFMGTVRSPRPLHRAIDELEVLDLVIAETNGKYRHIHFIGERDALWNRALPLLRSPVRKRRRIRWNAELTKLPLAGESALAQQTDISAPVIEVRAIAASD